ncbi:MAG: flagellar biosynthesis anti-sigma factor FlgM [Vicinamibacterales bacterium]
MTIKIDANRQVADADATRRATTPRTGDRASADRAATKTDRVEVSSGAQLMTRALKAATDTPTVRHDVVERMRKLLDSGELGKDSGKLADALIDHMLKK